MSKIYTYAFLCLVLNLVLSNSSLAENTDADPNQTLAEDLVPEANEVNEKFVKEALGYLLNSHKIPLTVNSSCETVGMDFTDKTIGDFTSGMLSQFVYAKGENSKNWISGVCRDGHRTSKIKPIRDCEITFHQARLEEEVLWSWGFKFSADKRNSTIIRSTLQCVAAG